MKKIISVILVLAMIFSMSTVCFADSSFKHGTKVEKTVTASKLTDIKGHKNFDAISTLYDLGIITGYTNNTFAPDKEINRGEVVTMLTKALYADKIEKSYLTTFADVPYTSWVREYVDTAFMNKLIYGYSATKFGVNDNITYDQIAAILTRALGYDSESLVGKYPDNSNYIAVIIGLFENVNGFGKINATRAEVAQMIYNAFDCYMVKALGNGNFNKTEKKLFETLGYSVKTKMLTDDMDTFGDEVITYKKDKKTVTTDFTLTDRIEGIVKSAHKVIVDDETITLGKDVEIYVNGERAHELVIECDYMLEEDYELPVSLIYDGDELVRVVQFVMTYKGFVDSEYVEPAEIEGGKLYISNVSEHNYGSVVEEYGNYIAYISNDTESGFITNITEKTTRHGKTLERTAVVTLNNGIEFEVDSEVIYIVLADISVGNVITLHYDYAGEIYAITDYFTAE